MSTLALTRPAPATRLVGAHLMSNLADGIRLTAFPLLVYALTASPVWVTVTFAAGLVPSVLLSPLAGALADRGDRRRILEIVLVARAVVLLVLAATVAVGHTPVVLVAIVAALFGVGEAFTDNTMAALVPVVVAGDRLDQVNGRMVGAEIVGNELAGPAIGSALFAVIAWLPFAAASWMLSIALALVGGLSLVVAHARAEGDVGNGGPRPDDSVLAGLRYVAAVPVLRRTIASTALLVGIDAAWFSLLVVLVTDELGLDEAAFGLLLALGAIGGLLGAMLAPRLRRVDGASLAGAVFAGMGASLVAVWLAPSVVTVAVALVVTSGAFAAWNVVAKGIHQRATPISVLGRVVAVSRTVTLLVSLLAALAGGWLTASFGIDVTIGVAALLLLAACPLVAWRMRGVPLGGQPVA